MSAPTDYPWDSFWQGVANLRNVMRGLRTERVTDTPTRELVKQVVQAYFRQMRPEVVVLGLDMSGTDALMQNLISMAAGNSRRTAYLQILGELEAAHRTLEAQRELKLGELAASVRNREANLTPLDAAILETLRKLVPNAAVSYEQVLTDLADMRRISFRGTAADLRETLREVLDYLAPDESVIAADGFELEPDQKHPTMRQKARFVLKARRRPEKARKVVENSISVVDEYRASAVRGAYDLASIASHVAASYDEVKQLKRYVETVLCDLLEVR